MVFHNDPRGQYRFTVDKFNGNPVINIGKYFRDLKTNKWVACRNNNVYLNMKKWNDMLQHLKQADAKFREIVNQGGNIVIINIPKIILAF